MYARTYVHISAQYTFAIDNLMYSKVISMARTDSAC